MKTYEEKSYPTHRPIVARFIYHNGLCPSKCENKLKGKPFGIHQWFPLDIENKLKQLYPVMKKARDNGNFTRMVSNKVYIDNNVHTPVLEFSKFLSDIHCPISIFIDHVKQYQCMRSSSNSWRNCKHTGGKIKIKCPFSWKSRIRAYDWLGELCD